MAANEAGEKTILKFYRRLLALRKNSAYEDVLVTGALEPAYTEEEHVFAYYRVSEDGKRRWIIFSNYQNVAWEHTIAEKVGELLLNNCENLEQTEKGYRFQPYQTVVWELLD